MQFPAAGTYNPFYQFYFNLVPHGDLLEILIQQKEEYVAFLQSIPHDKYDFSYGPGKWTVKEAILHVTDTERVYGYRSLVAGRMDGQTDLTPFDENEYAAHADTKDRTLQDLIDEFKAVRDSSIFLFKNLNDYQASFIAKNGKHPFTANGGLCFIIGHVTHHVNVIKERYLV
ncbi:MAG: DinB family protein [Bacteroidetes bacterium]|jgi:uncharacterized damage-inducible protein DinB|nr:DinB family protein [Bacteroidota bacterium]MCB0605299.1 DinB family protein [Saprospiraceae bacterium]